MSEDHVYLGVIRMLVYDGIRSGREDWRVGPGLTGRRTAPCRLALGSGPMFEALANLLALEDLAQ